MVAKNNGLDVIIQYMMSPMLHYEMYLRNFTKYETKNILVKIYVHLYISVWVDRNCLPHVSGVMFYGYERILALVIYRQTNKETLFKFRKGIGHQSQFVCCNHYGAHVK
jgi:hypothetical protein